MNETLMTWARRILLAVPFALATVLTVLISCADRLHLRGQRMAGYGFAFGTPWAWLLDRGWLGDVHSRFLQMLSVYAVILWIPAILYSACLWLLVRLVELGARRVRD
jgi:hypothetical protein